ncbi:MAG TPA: hypothetical protein VFS66_05655 [Acidimicrobiia bacterium]|nr:hypothetical protein [Acidimicrobiia bacterium]
MRTDIRLAYARRDHLLEEADRARQARQARAIRNSRLREQLGRSLISMGERLEQRETRIA